MRERGEKKPKMEVNSFFNNQNLNSDILSHLLHALVNFGALWVETTQRFEYQELQIIEDHPRGCLSFLGIVIDSILTCFDLNICCKIYSYLLLLFSWSVMSDSLQLH